jgi:hypothetical protein
MIRMFLTPGWVLFHLLIWAASVAMVLLGRWQLDVSNSKHFNLQNFGYTLQWWAFTAFAILLWLRVIRDAWRNANGKPTAVPGQQVVRADRKGGLAYAGPAELVALPTKPGQAPVTYRGYVMPQSATTLASSQGDRMHAAYNDYLWQLAMADSELPADLADPRSFQDRPVPAPEPRTDTASARPTAESPAIDPGPER